ncbi:unnamed protein product [Cyclocybe aegerita]|uniref:separase n=1 Tax=Cyclocybe aegerita TaxID=1973307 RepID=A0A8S0W8A7_CYCAE|nr:unnamed protein product [Cyclocybe aegerita]
MSSTTRRPISRQLITKSTKSNSTTADQLAKDLASKLTLNSTKGKQKAEEHDVNPGRAKLTSMRAVNEASQTLSAVVQSGWKKTAPDASKTTLSTANTAASTASKHLETLRRVSPGDIDVERAAVSVLGKLIALEMYELGTPVLREIHPRICSLVDSTYTPNGHPRLRFLSIPLPSMDTTTNPVLLNLISTYLLFAIILATCPGSATPQSTEELAETLASPTTHSLTTWLPLFSALPSKHTDPLLTRAYSALSKLFLSSSAPPFKSKSSKTAVVPSPSPGSIFALRAYGLRCLVNTSPGVIDANVFWDQAVKSTAVLVRASSTDQVSEEEISVTILAVFHQLVGLAEKRADREKFLAVNETGKNFMTFCDYWASFAKRAGDIAALQRINAMLRPTSLLFTPPHETMPAVKAAPSPQKQSSPQKAALLEGSRMHNTLTQLSLMLEAPRSDFKDLDNDSDLHRLLDECLQLLRDPAAISPFLQPRQQTMERKSRNDDEMSRICIKVDRALEKLRRTAIKYVEAGSSSSSTFPVATLKTDVLLEDVLLASVARLQSLLLSEVLPAPVARDALTRSLDTLFVLSRIRLNPNDPRTFVPPFDHLSLASTIVNSVPSDRYPLSPLDDSVDIANYYRCVSGAFYNLAGSLYQATRYGNAVPFLVETCRLGEKALCLPRPQPEVPNEAREKEWKQLEEQLFRRWELLGVCYSKNGNHKNAYDAFKQAIRSFPFSSSGLTTQSEMLSPDSLFGSSSNAVVKQLVSLIDRVSYLGACNLLLPPNEISLRSNVHGSASPLLDPATVGILLERQLDSLEPSRWKDGIRGVSVKLLRDALDVYDLRTPDGSRLTPVRRARIVVRCMEFVYRSPGDEAVSIFGFSSVEDMGKEIESLGTLENFEKDALLVDFVLQYRISSRLWMALHAHRRADPEQNSIMSQHSEAACHLIKELLSRGAEATRKATRKVSSPKALRKASSPKVGRIISPKAPRSTRQRVPAAPRKAAPVKSKSVASVTPKPRTRNALQPMSFNATQMTPPRRSIDGASSKATLIFDDFDRLLSLLQLTARILGFLSLILAKARLLDMTRRLAQRHEGTTSDGYITASIELAHEYVTLGKLKRAASIFNQALEVVRSGQASPDVSVRFLLRFAESLALVDDVPKSLAVYLEALNMATQVDLEQKGQSTQQRIYARTKVLEMAAMASHVFALVQYAKGDVCASLQGLLQSLRLWNRAIDTMTRLKPATANSSESDPFEMSSLKDSLPNGASSSSSQESPISTATKSTAVRAPMDDLEWRISEGLLSTMFSLTQAYFYRGSPREAEYFAKQAANLAGQLNTPAMVSRALARQGELQLHMGNLEDARVNLTKATELLCDMPGIDTADIRRLKVEYNIRTATEEDEDEDPQQLFNETVQMLEELDVVFRQFDNTAFGPRRSLGTSPRHVGPAPTDVLVPELLASILRQQLWLLRDEIGDVFNSILEKYLSLSWSTATKAEEYGLMGKLTLHSVYGRFQTDMFLSSIAESTVAIPMGMETREHVQPMLPSADIVEALANAEKLLWTHLASTARKGNVIEVRESVISLVLIGAFRTSLGDRRQDVPSTMAALLDASAALTLRRDMLEAIDSKFPLSVDDLQWPLLLKDGAALPRSPPSTNSKLRTSSLSDSEDEREDEASDAEKSIRSYWDTVRAKYETQALDPSALSVSETVGLPANWTVINMSITADKSTLFCCRREGGNHSEDPLIFCIPLKGRRDQGSNEDEEAHLTFERTLQELQDIVRSSDECTKAAINVKSDDEEARVNWWRQRTELDTRMRQLLENIEYCWLGAFKVILSPRPSITAEDVSELRGQFEKVFYRALHVKDKKPKKPAAHKKSTSQPQTHLPTQFTLDDAMIKCLSTLSPKCRDEELEDFIYFVLDLYQFHGVPIAIAEVDIDQVVVDLRTVLEEHSTRRTKYPRSSRVPSKPSDEHIFLVLDKNVQGLPWESLPILRGRSVSRIPGVQFLHDRLAYAKCKHESTPATGQTSRGAAVNPRKGYYILNPSGDLGRTEERFRDWANGMKKVGWEGTIGKPVSEQQFVNALKSNDLVVYFGHGGGEQYVRSHRIRSLPTCAATMLWGCSSGALRDMGDFDRTGTPYNYMLAGCPTLVANLWDVTDKDIDKFSQTVFDKLSLNGKDISESQEKRAKDPISVVAAVAQSRDACKLKYLTGAAPVVYGIPFYL